MDTHPDPALIRGSDSERWLGMTNDQQAANPDVLEGLRMETGGHGRQFIGSASATVNGKPTGLGMGQINAPAEVSPGGGRLLATYAPDQSPAAQPGYRGQTIAELGPTARQRVDALGGLAGTRRAGLPSREERLSGLGSSAEMARVNANRAMAGNALAAQERMQGHSLASGERVAGLGLAAAAQNKAAERTHELEKTRIQAGGRYETDENGNQVYVPGKVSGPAANKYNSMAPDDVRAAVVSLSELESSPIVGTGFRGRVTADDTANRQAQIKAAKDGMAAVGLTPQGTPLHAQASVATEKKNDEPVGMIVRNPKTGERKQKQADGSWKSI